MRILSVLTYYYPHWTGLTAHARQLAEGLVRRGHSVTVLTHQHLPSLPRNELVAGVQVERVPPLLRISRGMLSPQFAGVASRLIREHDAVLINTPMFEALPVALLCRTHGRPMVMVHHGDLVMPAGLANRIVERVTVASMAGAARVASRLTTYSEDYGEHSDFLLPYRPRLVAIAPTVEIPEPDLEAAASWRRDLGLENRQIIGFAGRFVEEKGGDLLLRAMPLLTAAMPGAQVVLAAETNVVYEKFFEHCRPLLEPVADRVTRLGLITDRQRLANFYAMCDVLALPSRTDCFALVQAEAMLCGTPVVASDIPGAREPVRRTQMGRLVTPHDPKALAVGLIEVLRDLAAYRRPRPEIAAIFDPERSIAAYETLLGEAVEGERVPTVAFSRAPAARPTTLSGTDRIALDTLLRNEVDMAFRRRILTLFEYLDLRDGDRVLDGGFGMGFALLAMNKLRRVRLAGIDIDAGKLAAARERGIPGILLAADMAHLPFASEGFDKVLLSEVLEHVDDDRAALQQVFDVLRPGGTLAISVPHANFPFCWDPINKLWTGIGGAPLRTGALVGIWSQHRRLYWPEDLRQRVAEAGFLIERVENATHYSVPLAHFLVYGVGKPLVEGNWLPASWQAHADRLGGAAKTSGTDPFALGRSLLAAVDRRNDRSEGNPHTFVNVLLKATKPVE